MSLTVKQLHQQGSQCVSHKDLFGPNFQSTL